MDRHLSVLNSFFFFGGGGGGVDRWFPFFKSFPYLLFSKVLGGVQFNAFDNLQSKMELYP